MSGPHPVERYLQLAAKVDGFFAQAQARVGASMQCASGCADCCQGRLTVTSVEAAVILSGLASLDDPQRSAIASRGATATDEKCAALDDHGRCSIYAWRPLVCRSHGVPVRVASDAPSRLPVLEVCPKNFTEGLDTVGGENILDQTTLSTVLGALDAAYADSAGLKRGTRHMIIDLLQGEAKETRDE